MKKKITGFLVVTLLIAITVVPAGGDDKINTSKTIENDNIETSTHSSTWG